MKLSAILLSLATILCLGLPRAEAATRQPTIAVLDVELLEIRLDPDVVSGLAAHVVSQVAQWGRYELIARDQISEQHARRTDSTGRACWDLACQRSLGRSLSAQKILSTRVIQRRKECEVTCTLSSVGFSSDQVRESERGGCAIEDIKASLDRVLAKLGEAAARVDSGQPAAVNAHTLSLAEDHLTMGQQAMQGRRKRPAQALSHFRQACDGGAVAGCRMAAMLLLRGRRPAKNAVQEAALRLERACEGEDWVSCRELALLLALGRGVPKNPLQAELLMEKACAGQDGRACLALGQRAEKAKGPRKQNRAEAKRFYEKACGLSVPEACKRASKIK